MPRKKQYHSTLRHRKHSRCPWIAQTKRSLVLRKVIINFTEKKMSSARDKTTDKNACFHAWIHHWVSFHFLFCWHHAKIYMKITLYAAHAGLLLILNHEIRTQQKSVLYFPENLTGSHLFVLISHKFTFTFLFQVWDTGVRGIMILLTEGIPSKPPLSSLLIPRWP